ncbi:1-acyl-sn-glycerol-3-phosphate acyltransferase [Pectobacterium parmentieri]|uniref:1-acyl-sn-glycerol-3-phosphate acyltransferase n=1 Tax=Pectobacterium parmentieri TaxID=1905730 RepID=A0A0H3IAT9_PECPM|nr:lysophospholipid acyltransferase family protein [Pectobacterium parmentieri]ACX89685.1 phospholipid/glycerol acyltransferase [Pectobacterium parmentieri WPP163]AFI92171.1 1-acyl-sn-glycerol-3-phosphate acyltransferase [Pectobacterium parmentieri]AOR61477.1 acyl-phosphate glycerol 3-phosphate acyltransferase [Pectobacterium parmentieri]AYH03075.1 1-acyl-sn-glycerol-3-phosphate acyltransferase [Pectobacterium parmentieri]AYH07403.1 1-acyl-sn-glycerol-3-phosphate acyltransferase [Pectobacteriu
MANVFSGLDKKIVSSLLVTVCRLLTGVRAHWRSEPDLVRPKIYYANHSSHLDGLVIWASLPRELRTIVHPVAAADYWLKKPLRRYLALRIFQAVLVERRNKIPEEGHSERLSQDPLQPLKTTLNENQSLILFPEGTRGDGDQLNSFKSGIYHLSKQYPDIELVPVWLENLNRVMPKGSRLVVPIICHATFGEPIQGVAEMESKQDFLERAKQALEELSA